MDKTEYRFDNYAFSRLKGLSLGNRQVRIPRRLLLLLQMLLEADGDAVDAGTLENAYSRKPKDPDAAKISLSQNVFWLRRYLKDEGGNIIQTVLKKGYRVGVPIIRADVSPTVEQNVAPPSGASPDQAAPAPARVVYEAAPGPATMSIIQPANENFGVAKLADLPSGAVVTKSITGRIRLADHAGRTIGSLGQLPDGKESAPSELAMLGWLKGVALGELEAGLSLVDRALALSPRLAIAHFYRAWLLLAARRMDQALGQLEQGLTCDSRNDSMLFLKGWALCALGYHTEQEALTLKALEFHPNHMMLRVLRSIGLAIQGETKRAESLITQTALLFPQSTLLVASLAWLKAVRNDGPAAMRLLTGRQKLANGYITPTSIAAVYNVLGDENAASAYLGFANVDQDP